MTVEKVWRMVKPAGAVAASVSAILGLAILYAQLGFWIPASRGYVKEKVEELSEVDIAIQKDVNSLKESRTNLEIVSLNKELRDLEFKLEDAKENKDVPLTETQKKLIREIEMQIFKVKEQIKEIGGVITNSISTS